MRGIGGERLGHHPTSPGTMISQPVASASARISRAGIGKVVLAERLGDVEPLCCEKRVAMPPPITEFVDLPDQVRQQGRAWSTPLRRRPRPRPDAPGCPAPARARAVSAAIERPAQEGSRCATPSVEACARCAAGKRVVACRCRPAPASSRASAGSFFSSPGKQRMFLAAGSSLARLTVASTAVLKSSNPQSAPAAPNAASSAGIVT